MRSLYICIGLFIFAYSFLETNAQVLRSEHEDSRLEGLTDISLIEGILSFKSESETEGFFVIESDAPLFLNSAHNVSVELSPGWDGSLGYKLYGIKFKIVRPGFCDLRIHVIEPPGQALPTSRQEIDTYKNQLESRPSKFPGEKSGFLDWQNSFRDSLAGILMGGGLPEKVPPDIVVEFEKVYDNFKLYFISYQSLEDRRVKALLSIPKNMGKVPLLLALHGHETKWGIADSAAFRMGHIDDFCAYFATRGWAVLQPATMDHHLQHPDWTLQGEWTWDAMTAIDICSSYPTIQMDRIAVCGLSTGGHLAMNLLALDQRVKAGVVGCVLSTWNHYEKRFRMPPHCDCGISQQLSFTMEQCDWAALASPKPVQFQHGLQDASFSPGAAEHLLDLRWNTGIMPQEEYEAMFSEISRAYGLFEKREFVNTVYHEGPHRINNKQAFDWLMKVLHLTAQQ